ncbi:MAG: hypothetical protein CSB44_03035 [Gammaproteobacteria bacterium]|nr:MAG: hypothetical protein CSB44_03035 [Gammaproteobacteria bacterium]PIE36638.1 MAG: hypothetical protein CSA54_03860 [Gammaproteobacteria bacterium]
MFKTLYQLIEAWGRHRHAEYYLAGVSFTGSSFFPLPVEMLLAPIVFARPEHAIRLGVLTALASILGSLLGYALGLFAMELIMPWIETLGYAATFEKVLHWFEHWGFWVVFVAGFGPFPYKLFTIGAGALAYPLVPFMIAVTVSRLARFVLMSLLLAKLGPLMVKAANRYMEWIGWGLAAAVVGVMIWSG